MNKVIPESCTHMLKYLTDKTPRDVFFNQCVQKRLTNMCAKADEEYDKELHNLEVGIDYNDFGQVKRCVTRLMRLMKKNRNSLMQTIERMV